MNQHLHLILSASLVLLCIGCGPEIPKEVPPDTVPVTGDVIGRDGRPLSNAMVEFRSIEGKAWTTISQTDESGAFALYTLVDGQQIEGAVVGKHRVSVMPPFTDDPEQSAAQPYQVGRPITVKAEGPNEFTIDMRR